MNCLKKKKKKLFREQDRERGQGVSDGRGEERHRSGYTASPGLEEVMAVVSTTLPIPERPDKPLRAHMPPLAQQATAAPKATNMEREWSMSSDKSELEDMSLAI